MKATLKMRLLNYIKIKEFKKHRNLLCFLVCTGGRNRTPSSGFGDPWFTINRRPQ